MKRYWVWVVPAAVAATSVAGQSTPRVKLPEASLKLPAGHVLGRTRLLRIGRLTRRSSSVRRTSEIGRTWLRRNWVRVAYQCEGEP
jgi:hypothetical protein